jgi:hypothetical protein
VEAEGVHTAGRTGKRSECLRMRIRISRLLGCDSRVSMCHVSTTDNSANAPAPANCKSRTTASTRSHSKSHDNDEQGAMDDEAISPRPTRPPGD